MGKQMRDLLADPTKLITVVVFTFGIAVWFLDLRIKAAVGQAQETFNRAILSESEIRRDTDMQAKESIDNAVRGSISNHIELLHQLREIQWQIGGLSNSFQRAVAEKKFTGGYAY